MSKLTHRAKVLLLDTAGVLLIIGSVLFGWLPGPGGIPLFLAGLGLLSINHEWAARLLSRVKERSGTILDQIFSDHPVVKFAFDVLGVVLVFLAIYLLNTYTHNVIRSAAVMAIFISLGVLLLNRKRLRRFTAWVKHK